MKRFPRLLQCSCVYRFFFFLYVPVLLLFTAFAFYTYRNAKNESTARLETVETNQLLQFKQLIASSLQTNLSDLSFLAKLSSLKDFLEKPESFTKNILTEDLENFCEKKPMYEQIFLMDIKKGEVLHIEQGPVDPKVSFKKSIQTAQVDTILKKMETLKKGEIYFSPIMLKREKDYLITPYTPLIFFGMPLFNSNNEKIGTLVLGYNVQFLIDQLTLFHPVLDENHYLLLLNKNGYFVKGVHPEDEWGHELPDRRDRTFSNLYPEVWKEIQKHPMLSTLTKAGLFISIQIVPLDFSGTLHPTEAPSENEWWVVLYLPTNELTTIWTSILFRFLSYYLFFFIIWTLFCIVLSLYFMKRRIALLKERDLNEKKSTFIMNVAHEFKNPLAVIGEYNALLLEKGVGPLNEEQEELISAEKKAVERLNRLISNLLNLAKFESKKIELKRTVCTLQDLTEEVASFLSLDFQKKSLNLTQELPKEPLTLFVDRDKILEILLNLLSNALKYTPKGGKITLRASQTLKFIRIEVEDTGPGIAPEHLGKIFDKFERFTSDAIEGTGLGLPITKDLVTLHGGTLEVKSSLGKGSTFIVTLPKPPIGEA